MHRSLQSGVRLWVAQQTAQPMGYVEQLYTFVDTRRQNDQGLPVLYVNGCFDILHRGHVTYLAQARSAGAA